MAGVELAMQGPVLEASVESVPSVVVLRVEPREAPQTKPRMTPPNTTMEERRLHIGVETI